MSYLERFKSANPSIAQRYSDDQIITALPDLFPDRFGGLSGDDLMARATLDGNDLRRHEMDDGRSQLRKGAEAGYNQLQALGGGATAFVGDALGMDSVRDWGMEVYNRNMEEAGESAPNVAGFTDIRGVEDATDWAMYTLGNLIPTMATTIGTGGVGGLVAAGGKKAVQSIVQKKMAEGFTAKAAAEVAAKEIARRYTAGTTAGAGVASLGMGTGEIYGETEDVGITAAHAPFYAVAEALPALRILDKFGPAGKQIKEGIAKRAAADVAIQGGLEAGTEAIQNLVEQHAKYWLDTEGQSLLANLDEVDGKALIDAGAAGFLGGAAMGSGARGIQSVRNRGETEEDQRHEAGNQAAAEAAARGGDPLDQELAAAAAEAQFTPAPDYSQFDRPAAQRDIESERSMSGVDGLIITAERMGFTDEVALLVTAKRLFGEAEAARVAGNDARASLYTRQANNLYRRATETNETLAAEAVNYPVPYVFQGDISSGEIVPAAPVGPTGDVFTQQPDPARVTGTRGRLEDSGTIFAPEPADVTAARQQREADNFSAFYGQEGQTPFRAEPLVGELDRSNELPSPVGRAALPPGTGQINMGLDAQAPAATVDGRAAAVGRNTIERQAAMPSALPAGSQTRSITPEQYSATMDLVRQALRTPDRSKQTPEMRQAIAVRQAVRAGDIQVSEAATPSSIAGQPMNNEWTAFSDDSGTLKVPRSDMPQVKAEHRGALVNFLKARGIEHRQAEIDPATLKPTQAEFSPAKVQKAREYQGGDRSILISSDGHVVDGHHQWMAKRDAGEPIKVIQLNAPISDLVPLIKEFPSSEQDAGAGRAGQEAPQQQSAPRSVAAITKRNRNAINADEDSMLVAIAKLGGLDRTLAEQEGVDPAYFNTREGIRWVFKRNGGRSFDGMAEALEQYGYLDSADRFRDFSDKLFRSLAGEGIYTAEGMYRQMENQVAEDANSAMAEAVRGRDEAVLADAGEYFGPDGVSIESLHMAQEALRAGMSEDEVIQSILASDFPIDFVVNVFTGEQDGRSEGSRGRETDANDQERRAPEENAGRNPSRAAETGRERQGNAPESQELLTSYSEQDLQAQAESQQASEQAALRTQAQAEQRAQADAEVSDFTLTGSNRTADVAAARGQNDLFGLSNTRSQQTETETLPANDSQVVTESEGSESNQLSAVIEDAGEKLGGARKDELRTARERLDSLDDKEIASSTLTKLWPKGEISKITDPVSAAIYHAARSEVPSKPRVGYKLKRWVEQVKHARDILRMIDEAGSARIIQEIRDSGSVSLKTFADKVELLAGIDRSQWDRIGRVERASGKYSDGEKMVPGSWVDVAIDGRNVAFYGKKDVSDVISDVQAHLNAREIEQPAMKFEIRRDRATGVYQINKTGDAEYRALKTFDSLQDARNYLRGNNTDLVEAWEAIKQRDNITKADMRSDTNIERTGQNYRDGKDVTPEEFIDVFGFRGVEFGNWVKQGRDGKERQGLLNDAYDAFMDLSKVLNLPPKALSFEGRLGIGFGSRGRGGRNSAHFEPDSTVINLTKTKGAGSLAHEWFHALDNYFSLKRGSVEFTGDQQAYREGSFVTYRPEPMMAYKPSLKTMRPYLITRAEYNSRKARDGFNESEWVKDPNHPEGVRPEVEKAFAELVETLDASPMMTRSRVIDKGKTDGYWSQIIERAARSFETHIIAKLAQQGYRNDFLANVTSFESFKRNPNRYPYLKPEEQGPVTDAFDKLFSTIETRTDDSGNVAMFQVGDGQSDSVDVTGIQSQVDQITSDWQNAPEISVVATEAELPEAIRQAASEQDVEGAIEGVMYRGKVYIVASRMKNQADVERVLFHEALGHYGLKQLYGPALELHLDQLWRRIGGIKGVRRLEKQYGFNLSPYWEGSEGWSAKERRQMMADELIAHLAGKGDIEPTLMQRIAHLIKEGLRKLFRNTALADGLDGMTDIELLQIVAGARRAVVEGRSAVTYLTHDPDYVAAFYSVMYSRVDQETDQTQTEAFREWFGDSKVVDANGDPMVVYHGTDADFTVFSEDAQRLPWNQGGVGHYFTSNPSDASGYGGTLIPAYIKALNPKRSEGFEHTNVTKDMVRDLKSQGYDAIYFDGKYTNTSGKEVQGPDEWVIFDSTQIKSATGNQGSFDPNNPDIRFSRVPDDAPVIETDGGPISKGQTLKEMALRAREYARKNFAGESFENKATGHQILIPMAGIRHTIFGAQEALLKSVAVTPEILKQGAYLGLAIDKAGNQNVKGVHYYGVKVSIDGEVHDIVAVVKEDDKGHRYYDHSIERKTGSNAHLISEKGALEPGEANDTASNLSIASDTEASTVPLSNEDLRAGIRAILPDFEDGDNRATIVNSFSGLPDVVKQEAKNQGSNGDDVEGVFHNGTIYVVADKITSAGQLETLLFHEGTHGGVNALYADEGVSRAMNRLYAAMGGSTGFNKVVDQLEIRNKIEPYIKGTLQREADGRVAMSRELRNTILMQEVLAYTGEKGSKSFQLRLRELVGAVRNWLREHGFLNLAELGVTDIAYIAKQAREQGLKQASDGGVTLFRFGDSVRNAFTSPEPDLTQGGFTIPTERMTDVIVRKFQDKFKVLRDVQAGIRKQGRTIAEDADAYMAEELFHGKTKEDLDVITDTMVKPFAQLLSKHKIDQADIDLYLMAKHAEERNAHIASINPDMPDGGSGLTNAQARQILSDVAGSGKQAQYDEIAQVVYDMLANRRTILTESGLLDQSEVDAWESKYQHYVPLKGWAANETQDGRPRTGKGLSIGGKETKRALGRTSQAASPSTYAIHDLTESIVRKRKNEVGNAFLNLVEQNPSKDYWQVFTDDNPETSRTIRKRKDENGNTVEEVVEQVIPMAMMSDRYFTTKKDGKTYYIKLEDQRLLNAMNNVGPEASNTLTRTMGTVTRFMSAMNTSYNPEFVVGNFARDVQTAILNLTAEQSRAGGKVEGEQIAAKTVKDIPKAMRAVYRGLRGHKATNPEWQQWYDEFRKAGAQTGYYDMKDIDGQMKDVERLVQIADGGFIGGFHKWRKAGAKLVEDMNGAVENAVRLSAYVNARKAGISQAQAASLAKNLTVNFNRRGEMGTMMNSLYMFFNASVQGTANFGRTMFGLKGNVDDPVWKRLTTAQKLAAGIAIGAYALAQANRMAAGEDDDGENWYDKVPDYVRERNLVIMKSLFGGPQDGSYWKIPLPYGYNIFAVFGENAQAAVSGNRSIGETAKELTMGVMGSFNPIGFVDSNSLTAGVLRNITPSIGKPIADLVANENFMGTSIYNENFPFGTPKPESQLSRRSTPAGYKAIAEWLNGVSGGSQWRAGSIDINPDAMRYMVDYFTGGAGAFFTSKAPDYAGRLIQGVEVEPHRTPFISRLNGRVLPYEDQSQFYKRRDEINQISEELKALRGREKTEFYRDNRDKLTLRPMIRTTENQLKALRRRRDAIQSDSSLTPRQKDQRLKEVEALMKRSVDRFNKRYNEV